MSAESNSSLEKQLSSTVGIQIIHDRQVNSIEALITDDASTRLESVTPEQLANVRLHFIGGTHTSEFESRWNEATASCNPDYIIMEGGTPTAAERHHAELIENLELRNIPIHVRSAADNKVYRLRTERAVDNGWHSAAKSVARQSHGEFPIVRLMDLAIDEQPELQRGYYTKTGVLGAGTYKTLALMTGLSRPLSDVITDFKSAVAADVEFENLREQRMIDDISIIVGNALARRPGKALSVAVLHGGHHTALYHYFQRLGVSASREFINNSAQRIGEASHFGRMDAASREIKFRGRLHDKNAIAAIVGRMVSVVAFGQQPNVDTKQIDLLLTDTDIAAVQEAWEKRDVSRTRKFSTAKKKAKAQAHLRQTLHSVAAHYV